MEEGPLERIYSQTYIYIKFTCFGTLLLIFNYIYIYIYIHYSKFDKHQDLIFVFQSILVMEYPNSVTDM